MDKIKLELSQKKYQLPYHWIRNSLHPESLPYFGYAKIILDELPNPPANILDAGCGDGRIVSEMINRGYKVTGIDYLDISIHYAKLMVSEAEFLVADLRKDLISEYCLKSKSFDAISMVEVYEHIPPEDCHNVLINLKQVLQPNGILIISVPNKTLPLSKLHYRHFEQSEFEMELEKAGFTIKKMIYQHKLDKVTKFILGKKVENFLNNRWFQPQVLNTLRKKWYMKHANIVNNPNNCGRFIAIAQANI